MIMSYKTYSPVTL